MRESAGGRGDDEPRHVSLGRLALSALAVVYGAATVAIARGDVPTTYAATSTGAAAADLAAGLGLIVVGTDG